MSELSNRAEVIGLKLKLQDLTNISFDKKLTESTLCNEITPYIAGFGLKKLFKKSNPKCNTCRNKLTYGHDTSDERKKSVGYNILFMNLRDKGGLIWPSKIVVLMTGLTIKAFESFLDSENMMNEYYIAASSSRIVLTALDEIIRDIFLKSYLHNAFKGDCKNCKLKMYSQYVTPFMTTIFKTTANNFTVLLNRKNMATKLSLKMVKDQVKQKKYVNSRKLKNDEEDPCTWTGEFCKTYLKTHGAVCQGKKTELINRCVLLKKLIAGGLEKLITLSKIDLRLMCTQLTLPDCSSITKDCLIKSVSDVTLGDYGVTTNGMLAQIDNEDELNS